MRSPPICRSGTVHYNANGVPEVEPDAQLRDLDIVRIFDYGLTGFTPPEVTVACDARPPLMALSDRIPGVRPRLTVGRRLDIAWRHAFPVTTSVLLMLLSLAPFGSVGPGGVAAAVALTCVWFWSLFRPAAMAPPIVFFIGLLLDLLGFLPLGVGEVTMLGDPRHRPEAAALPVPARVRRRLADLHHASPAASPP